MGSVRLLPLIVCLMVVGNTSTKCIARSFIMQNNTTRYREFASIPKRRNSTNVLNLYFQILLELSISCSYQYLAATNFTNMTNVT